MLNPLLITCPCLIACVFQKRGKPYILPLLFQYEGQHSTSKLKTSQQIHKEWFQLADLNLWTRDLRAGEREAEKLSSPLSTAASILILIFIYT